MTDLNNVVPLSTALSPEVEPLILSQVDEAFAVLEEYTVDVQSKSKSWVEIKEQLLNFECEYSTYEPDVTQRVRSCVELTDIFFGSLISSFVIVSELELLKPDIQHKIKTSLQESHTGVKIALPKEVSAIVEVQKDIVGCLEVLQEDMDRVIETLGNGLDIVKEMERILYQYTAGSTANEVLSAYRWFQDYNIDMRDLLSEVGFTMNQFVESTNIMQLLSMKEEVLPVVID